MAVLTPYRPGRAGRRFRPVSLIMLLLYSGLTGAALALLPPQLMFILAVPIIAALGLILWLLPDGGHVPEKAMATLLVAWIVANCLWPNYISLDLPGLPWINPPRIIVIVLLTMSLIAFSTSSKMRAETAASLRAIPFLKWVFWVFWAMTLITIPLSFSPAFSLNKWINNQVFWTFLFILSAWLCVRPGVIGRISRVLTWSAILVSLVAIYEYSIQQVPWANSIPSWLAVDDSQLIGNILTGATRAGTEIYRARGTFNHPLVLAEYLGIIYPFVLHSIVISQGFVKKSLVTVGALAVLAAMYLSGARSGMIGFFMAIFLYGGFAAFRHWRRQQQSLIGVSTLAMVPVAAVIFLALAITWPRLHNMTFGGAEHNPSSEARTAQWTMGIPRFLENPIGHGAGTGGDVLGYTNLAGEGTIDTYYVSLLLEYGLIGFVAFMLLFGAQLIWGLKMYLVADPGENTYAGPATIALLNFLVIKSVLSSEFNMPLAFVFLGFLFAINFRMQSRSSQASVTSAPVVGRLRKLAV